MATHRTFASLGKAIRQYGDTVEKQANVAKIKLATSIAHSVIELTPVDTGQARSNWLAKRNSPPSHTRRPLVPGSQLGRSERANLNAAYGQIVGIFAQAKPGERLYLKNNLKYIARLNAGYSKQSPAGFVQMAVLNGLISLRNLKLLEK